MKIALVTIFYSFVMLFVSSLYNSTIMDPIQLLWGLCHLFVGPALLIISAIILVQGVMRHSIPPSQMAVNVLSIITVVVWTFGFWRIGDLLRPICFRLVAAENGRLAISFMQQYPPDVDVRVSGFCYPYCSLGRTRASHHGGIVSVMVPSAPGPKDSLVYVSHGSTVPEGLHHICWFLVLRSCHYKLSRPTQRFSCRSGAAELCLHGTLDAAPGRS